MTGEELERAIDFLRKRQTTSSKALALTNEAVNRLAESVAQDRRKNREQREACRLKSREQLEQTSAESEADWQETREAINNLIIANEVTRDLAERVAALAISTSQRVTVLEAARED